MSSPLWLVSLLKKAFAGRYLMARSTRAPIAGAVVDRMLFAGDDLFYLPDDQAVRRIPIGQAVNDPGSVVLPSQVVEHFIELAEYHWLMNTCICREAAHCKDYPIDLGCLFLGRAALGIDPRLGRQVTKQEALEHVRRCREAGLVHLIGRNKLDTMWLGIGPGDRLLTICNCCPCCCLWRVLPLMDERISHKVSRMDGVSVTVSDRCSGCGACTDGVCFVDAIHLLDGHAVISDECRGCGRCVDVCQDGAIDVTVADSQFVARSIERIAALVDVT
jgi:NAD-dependent dihydropyrimidine dehydrogenase PreA subunit